MSDSTREPDTGETLHCSFCGESQHDVKKLIAGPSVYICDQCVALADGIIREALADAPDSPLADIPTPRTIHATLDEYIIKQQAAKRVLAVAVYNHYKRLRAPAGKDEVELTKSNILMIGPTGSGKTLLAETLARLLDVPFAIADATTLTEAGYVGEDVENVLQKLLRTCDYDIEKAQTGIIYIDEIDKVTRRSANPSLTRDVSGEGVQQALLKLIEGATASVPPQGGRKHPQQEMTQIDTRNILFICGGAFAGLDDVIRQRTEQAGIGFCADIKAKNDRRQQDQLMAEAEPDDLINYGLIPELVGRLPVLTTLEALDEEALLAILTKPRTALVKQYRYLFQMEGAELHFEDDALRSIARQAMARKTGARGLRTILENALLDTMYELPALENVRQVTLDEKVITEGRAPYLDYWQSARQSSTAAE